MLTTMLSVTNTTAAPDLDCFDPDHTTVGDFRETSRSRRRSS
jgi:hypothetical protein